ncbi:hypothetical protein diail_2045 [Diaporthe ilicicola]|nr:hypothetical protein diail_2045 [Diaporthe ilicicola]
MHSGTLLPALALCASTFAGTVPIQMYVRQAPTTLDAAFNAADPDARLFYNDYNLEYGADKAQAAARIVQLVQSYGARIDGVGLQGHLTSEPTASSGGGVAPDLATLKSTLSTVGPIKF